MRITKYGHACLLIEEGAARLLIDPGAFSAGFEQLTDIDAILITHQHQDHCVPETIKALQTSNPSAQVLADEDSARLLEQAGVQARPLKAGDEVEVGGVAVAARGGQHAVIHQELAGITNLGYLVAGRFFYPGDSFAPPGQAVEVLAAPAAAPWMSIDEAIDYVRAVKPRVAIPVHDAILSADGLGVHHGMLQRMTADMGVQWHILTNGQAAEL